MVETAVPRPGRTRRRRRRITPRFFVMVSVLLVMVYLCYGYVDGFRKMTQLRGALREVKQQAAVLEARNGQLRAELARLQSDRYIERVARQELGLVMPGEKVYVVITEEGVRPD